MFVKFEKFRVIERKDGAVFKTKREGFAWFHINETPPEQDGDIIWASTLDCHFGSKETLPKL